jgi:hypothetical protein
MMPGEDDAQKGPNPQVKGPSKKEFERFLERLLKGKS